MKAAEFYRKALLLPTAMIWRGQYFTGGLHVGAVLGDSGRIKAPGTLPHVHTLPLDVPDGVNPLRN